MNKKIWNGVKIILLTLLSLFGIIVIWFAVGATIDDDGSGWHREYKINEPIPNDVLTINQLEELSEEYRKKYFDRYTEMKNVGKWISFSEDSKNISITYSGDNITLKEFFGLNSVYTWFEIFFNLETGEITYAKKYSGHGFGYVSESDNWNSFYKEFEGKYQDPGEMTIEEFLSYGE